MSLWPVDVEARMTAGLSLVVGCRVEILEMIGGESDSTIAGSDIIVVRREGMLIALSKVARRSCTVGCLVTVGCLETTGVRNVDCRRGTVCCRSKVGSESMSSTGSS